jgi:hypothetical protein
MTYKTKQQLKDMVETKPKRTRKPRTKSKGLGDSVEKVTKSTGIDKVVKFIAGEDCGCDKRKEFLNRKFPYKKIQCLNESDYNYLTLFFESNTNTIVPSQQRTLIDIYNTTFNTKEQVTSCADCWRKIISELKQVYDEY